MVKTSSQNQPRSVCGAGAHYKRNFSLYKAYADATFTETFSGKTE